MHAVALDFERQVPFRGCFNFRDLGGYRTGDGHWIRPQYLYRADGPHALTDSDVAKLRELHLATVIDLRTTEEIERLSCYAQVLADVVEYHLPMFDVLPDADDLSAWTAPEVVAGRYRDMFDSGEDAIAEILAILSDPSAYPAVFHCAAGKDRTGIIAAVLLGVLGVPDEAIIADYAMSGESMHRLVEHYHAMYPDAKEQLTRVAPAMVAADPTAMATFVDDIRRDFGSFDGYAEAIGVGSAPGYIRRALLI